MSDKPEDTQRSTRLERAFKWLFGVALVMGLFIVVIRVAGGLAPLLVVLTLVINVFVHEAAHALVALAAGHDVHVIAVGRTAFFPRTWRFDFNHESPPETWGHVVHSPSKPTAGNRNWDGWIIAAGPISNFALAGLAFIALAILSYGEQSSSWNAISITHSAGADGTGALTLFGIVSFLVGFWCLASESKGSDGQRLRRRREGFGPDDAARRLEKLYALSIESRDKTSWDEELVRQVEQDTLDSENARLRDYLLVGRYLQVGDVRALKRLLRKSEGTQNCTEPFLVLTYAFAIALVDRNGDVAGQWLDRVPHEFRHRFEYWRSKAVVCAASGDYDAARAAAVEARKDGTRGDDDDMALFAAIENGDPLPETFVKTHHTLARRQS